MDYFRDNPYRLLGQSSLADMQSLRSAAKAARAESHVGIRRNIALSDVFGSDSLDQVEQIVRQCSADLVLRSCFRYAWPVSPLPAIGDAALSNVNVPEATAKQAEFLSAWVSFLESKTAPTLEKALANWQECYKDPIIDELLAKTLAEEERIVVGEAFSVVYQAQEKVGQQVLDVAAASVLTRLSQGQIAASIGLLKAIVDSPMDDHWEEVALRPIADHNRKIVKEISQADTTWNLEWVDKYRASAKQVLTFAELMATRYPGVAHWREEINSHYDSVAGQIRVWAIEQHNKHGRTAMASQAIDSALQLPISQAGRDVLAKDKEDLKGLLANSGPSGCSGSKLLLLAAGIALPYLLVTNWDSISAGYGNSDQGAGTRSFSSTPPTNAVDATEAPAAPEVSKDAPQERVPAVTPVKPERPPFSLPNDSDITAPTGPKGEGILHVENGNDVDAAVKIVPTGYGSQRYVYIRKGQKGRISRIYPGTYAVLVRSGVDWDKVNLNFLRNESLSKFTDDFVFTESIEETAEGTIHRYSTWTVTLFTVSGGNADSQPISEEEFND